MPLPRWMRRETLEEIERDIELAKTSAEEYRRLAREKGKGSYIRLMGSEFLQKSMKAQFFEDFRDAYTDEEKAQVIEHCIRRLMAGGKARRIAEPMVFKWLAEGEGEY